MLVRTAVQRALLSSHRSALPPASLLCPTAAAPAGAELEAKVGGMTPLMLAVSQGQLECMRLLLGAGADCSPVDRKGRTAAALAVRRNDAAALRLLMWGEGEEDSDDEDSHSSSSSSSSGGGGGGASSGGSAINDWGWPQRRFASALESDSAGRTLLHHAAADGRLAVMAPLLFPSALAARDAAGLTPLQAAVRAGQGEAARILLSSRAQELLTEQHMLKTQLAESKRRLAQVTQQQLQRDREGDEQVRQLQRTLEEKEEHLRQLQEANSLLQQNVGRRRFNYKSWAKQKVCSQHSAFSAFASAVGQ